MLAVVAALLFPTAVPDDLTLPPIDVGDVFGQDVIDEAKRYERFLYADWLLAEITLLVVLWLYAKRGIAFMRESAAGPIGTGMLLGMLGLAIVWLVQLPFGLAAHWWDRRYDVTDLDYLEWAVQDWALLAGEFMYICLALLIVMGLARWLGEHWWLPGAAVFVAIAALFSFTAPYLYLASFPNEPLDDSALVAAAGDYERELGVGHIPVRVEEVSDYTDQANAFAFGLGPSRRVVFWDTILLPPFSEDQQKVVLAHELAHHSSEHLSEGLAWFAIFAIPGAWILMRATRSRGGMGAPEAVPVALIAVAVISLVAAPAQNWISRRAEAEADWKALQVTRDPDALEELMVNFSQQSLGDPDPPFLAQLYLGTHPSLADRVAMARAWKERGSP